MTRNPTLREVIMEKTGSCRAEILKEVPNLKPEEYFQLVHLILGSDLGKGTYAGLEFPLEDESYLKELRALSNRYLKFNNGVVRMGVNKTSNLEEILRAPYIKPRTVHIF